MICRLLLLVAATPLFACGAGKQRAAAPGASAEVEIPGATPEQLQHFDADQSAPPAARTGHPRESERPYHRHVRPDEPASQQWSGSGSVGGPDCNAAAVCCEKLVGQQHGLNPSAIKVCESFRHRPSSSCRQILDLFRQAVKRSGGGCP